MTAADRRLRPGPVRLSTRITVTCPHDGHTDDCAVGVHRQHADHAHVQGEGCGHVTVPHDDHMDYVHDSHRHAAAHEGHRGGH